MQSEEEFTAVSPYLFCNYYISDPYVKRLKSGIKAFMHNRDKDDLYFSFMDWQKSDHEIVVWTMYAYADLPLAVHFDIIFQIENPDVYFETEFEVKYAIFNGWAPMNLITRGHKHILVLTFKNAVPDIFHVLSDYNGKKKNILNLGFCNKSEFENVKRNLQTGL